MPIIAFANPKGGTGKSTTALILATIFAKSGARVHVIDADPNRAIAEWASAGASPNLSVISTNGADDIIDEIERAAESSTFVIVDLEGTASSLVTNTLAVADFVIVPMQGSPLDARHGIRAIKLARNAEKVSRRRIPASVVMTNTGAAVKTRDYRAIVAQLASANVPTFATTIVNRAAYRAIFSYKRPLDALDDKAIPGLQAAIKNAVDFAAEVKDWMKAEKAKGLTNAA
jgi:chromosome partitioning protein